MLWSVGLQSLPARAAFIWDGNSLTRPWDGNSLASISNTNSRENVKVKEVKKIFLGKRQNTLTNATKAGLNKEVKLK